MSHTARVVVGAGCFWCVEAIFERVKGVLAVKSGYAGGRVENPTYDEVCSGVTGHAEVVEITFDPARVRYGQLLELFWQAHDPTTLNQQGADVGTQYRSVIFYEDEASRLEAEVSKKAAVVHFKNPIVTEISPLTVFYPAEEYHQDYFRLNPRAGYCQFVIRPKLAKLAEALA